MLAGAGLGIALGVEDSTTGGGVVGRLSTHVFPESGAGAGAGGVTGTDGAAGVAGCW